MKITILGASHGIPEPGRRCACTLIQIGQRYYIIDAGMQVMEELINRHIPPAAVAGVFVTHMHGDHTNGLINFVDLISWYFTDANPPIYLPDLACVDVICQWLRLNGGVACRGDFRQLTAGTFFDDGTLRVTAVPNRHCKDSYSLVLEAEGKTVVFTGDLLNPPEDFPAPALERETELIVCECTHFPVEAYQDILPRCATRQVCIHHYRTQRLEQLPALQAAMPTVPFVIATDGLELEI